MKISNSLKFKLSAAVLGVVALGLNLTSAAAATATTTFAVTATVQATCTVTATGMAIRNLHQHSGVYLNFYRYGHLHQWNDVQRRLGCRSDVGCDRDHTTDEEWCGSAELCAVLGLRSHYQLG